MPESSMIKHCHHHGFTVSNIERSLQFYCDVLGLTVVRVNDRKNLPSYDAILGYQDVKLRVALLSHPVNGFLLELFEYRNPPAESRPLENYFVGASHVAYEVGDIDAIYSRLTAMDYRAISPPVDVVRDGVKVARALYALDPDGISVELFQECANVVEN
jgi:glyoxylase I family protein